MNVQAAGNSKIGLEPSGTGHYTIGDDFYVIMWIDGDSDEPVHGWETDITFNQTAAGIINCTSVSFTDAFWDDFTNDGAIDNTTGKLTGTWAINTGNPSTANQTAMNLSFSTLEVGFVYIKLLDAEVQNALGTAYTTNTYNTTVTIHPMYPSGLTATTLGTDSINVSWTDSLGTGADKYVLFGSDVNSPTDRDPSEELYNGTEAYFLHQPIFDDTTYYYTLWTYNTRTGLYSKLFQQESNTTDADTGLHTPPTIGTPLTTNGSTIAETTSHTWRIPVSDAEGHAMTVYLNCSNGQSDVETANNKTYSGTFTGLSPGSTYTVWVNVSDAYNTSTKWFTFSVNDAPQGGGGGGSWNPSPANAAPSVAINTALSVSVNDTEGDFVTVAFYWGNGTHIGNDTVPTGDGTASVNPTGDLDYNTEYTWYVIANDSFDTTRGPTTGTWSFNTSTLGIDIQASWVAIPANNTIHTWINVTNTGTTNFTDVDIWVREQSDLYLESYNHSSDFTGNGHWNWEIPYLNYTGENHWYNISMYHSINHYGKLANGTSFWLLTNVSHLSQTDSQNLTGLEISYTASKEANLSFMNSTQLDVQWWINVTNTGDFTLNNFYINETYDNYINYTSSNIPAVDVDDTVFQFASIAPAATSTLIVNVTATADSIANGSFVYNNVTLESDNTSQSTLSERLSYGGYTTMIEVTYTIDSTDVTSIGDSVLSIIGILLIIGSILLIIGIVYRSGLLGGGI